MGVQEEERLGAKDWKSSVLGPSGERRKGQDRSKSQCREMEWAGQRDGTGESFTSAGIGMSWSLR